jgi:hypothetical protein
MPLKERAIEMKRALDGHGMGAYTHSKGTLSFRQDVARIKDPSGCCCDGIIIHIPQKVRGV